MMRPVCIFLTPNLSSWCFGLSWSYPTSKINVLHYTYGNRRNLGYKYFSWNCDRGLLSKHKIEDVRIVAEKYKPHFMAISEVDLRRNEFSTEQLHEVLRIDGYKIILPCS